MCLFYFFPNHTKLAGGFKYFLFSPLFKEDYHFDEHIFQRGWFNHQPEKVQSASSNCCFFTVVRHRCLSTLRGFVHVAVILTQQRPNKKTTFKEQTYWQQNLSSLVVMLYVVAFCNYISFNIPSLPNTMLVGVWTPKHLLRSLLGVPNNSSQGI